MLFNACVSPGFKIMSARSLAERMRRARRPLPRQYLPLREDPSAPPLRGNAIEHVAVRNQYQRSLELEQAFFQNFKRWNIFEIVGWFIQQQTSAGDELGDQYRAPLRGESHRSSLVFRRNFAADDVSADGPW